MTTPEAAARQSIDAALEQAGWIIQDVQTANVQAGRGVAIREVPLRGGHGTADYLLFADGRAVGAVEAKPVGSTLTGVELQTGKYSQGLPTHIPAPVRPLPFLYESMKAPASRRASPTGSTRSPGVDASSSFTVPPTQAICLAR